MKNSNIYIGILTLLIISITTSCKEKPDAKEAKTSINNEAVTYERVDANTNSNADEILALYAYGMAITQSYDCSDPASWYYQGSIHSVPKRDEITGDIVELCPSYKNDNDILRAWNSCPHMYTTDKQLNFLTWHRLYIYYYERNIRHQIANGGNGFAGLGEDIANKFSLPYWDYTNQGDMPIPFIKEDMNYKEVTLTSNPLYEIGRSRTLMAGDPIDYEATDSIFINLTNVDGDGKNLCVKTMKQALNYDDFLALTDVSEFSRGMEDRLHNVMHDYIGGAVDTLDQAGTIYNRIYQNDKSGFGLMGQIPSAGFDPIFFQHHSNVDRMFAAWEAMYGPITIDEMNKYAGTWDEVGKIYEFWDAPTGKWINYKSMQEMLDAAHAVPYTYEYLPTVESGLKKSNNQTTLRSSIADADISDSQRLTKNGAAFTIETNSIKALKNTNSRYTLEVDLEFGSNMFQQLLVISIPDDMDWTACDLDENYVHSISAFFGSTHEMHAGMHGETEEGKEFSHTILADVTYAVKNLPAGESLKVYVVPMNTENGPDFHVKNITLFEQH